MTILSFFGSPVFLMSLLVLWFVQDVSKQLHGVYDVWVLPILPVQRDELLPRQDCFHQQQDEDRPQQSWRFRP